MKLYHVENKKKKELSKYQIELNEAQMFAMNGLLSLSVTAEMEVAYTEFVYSVAKAKLESTAKRIEYKYPSAAESIRDMGAEKKFRKINGYKLIPLLINALEGKDISTTSSLVG